jgi:leader peptidase (prepilin peptidase)/N-methyltransferase
MPGWLGGGCRCWAAVLGLLIGSFLNVVIYRLPKMMERQWAAECAEMTGKAPPEQEPST